MPAWNAPSSSVRTVGPEPRETSEKFARERADALRPRRQKYPDVRAVSEP